MKWILIISTFIMASNAVARKPSAEDRAYMKSRQHFENKDYFSALDAIARRYYTHSPEQNIKNYIEMLASKTGTHYFNTYKDIQLRKINTPTTQLIMAKRIFI
jgi:hypothetical protein